VVFNVKPPFRIRDKSAWRRQWESSLVHFPASFGSETKDGKLIPNGDLAVARYLLYRYTGLPFDPGRDAKCRRVPENGCPLVDRPPARLAAV